MNTLFVHNVLTSVVIILLTNIPLEIKCPTNAKKCLNGQEKEYTLVVSIYFFTTNIIMKSSTNPQEEKV